VDWRAVTPPATPARPPPPAFLDDLAETHAHIWRQLARGVADRRSPFHTPTLATTTLDGLPALRTVVLRGVDTSTRVLRMHTDTRSGKWRELAAHATAALHVYDAGQKIQIRLAGLVTCHAGDAIALQAWEQSRPTARACYAQPIAPGTAVPDPIQAPTPADEIAVANFGVVRLQVSSLEWLYLAAAGHRRARFTWTGEQMAAQWLAP
jgi:pyridoxamine 5'-phosphate oxidase